MSYKSVRDGKETSERPLDSLWISVPTEFSYKNNERYANHRIFLEKRIVGLKKMLDSPSHQERQEEIKNKIERTKERYNWTLKALVEANQGLISSRRIIERMRRELDVQDTISEGYFSLLKTATYWDPNGKSSFAHYFCVILERGLKECKRKERNRRIKVDDYAEVIKPIQEERAKRESPLDDLVSRESFDEVKEVLGELTENEQNAIRVVFREGVMVVRGKSVIGTGTRTSDRSARSAYEKLRKSLKDK